MAFILLLRQQVKALCIRGPHPAKTNSCHPCPLGAKVGSCPDLEIPAFGLERNMEHAFEIDRRYAVGPDRHGLGIEFEFDGLMHFRVDSPGCPAAS